MQLILGSQSPRRKEILEFFSIPFTQANPLFDENSVPFNGNPEDYVCALSKGKAESLADKFPESIILTADTIVFHEGKVYGKPRDKNEAYQTLAELAGKWHSVFTGVTIQNKNMSFSQAEATHVLFNELTSEQVHRYITQINWADKAGGYAIQMQGGIIVRKIEGCYYNVKGLPINLVENLLKHFGIELWNYL